MGQICYLETAEPQEISFKVCIMFYNALSDVSRRREKVFLESFNLPKCMVVGFLMVEGLFSLLLH